MVCREASVGRNRGDVPFDLDAVAEAAHEGREATVGCVDGEPARGAAVGDAKSVGEAGRRGDESAGRDGDRFGLGTDLEDQLSLEDIEGVGVPLVDVPAGDVLARRVAGAGDRQIFAGDHEAALPRRAVADLLHPDRGHTIGNVALVLREITAENRDQVVELRVAPSQTRFVGTVADALADADEIPEGNAWYRAVYADGVPVGFVMLSWNVVPQPPRIIGPWFLWKLLIDERYQRRGYGSEVVKQVARIVHENGGSELLTSCVQASDGPEAFYRRLGFEPTGDFDENGEVILTLKLPSDR